MGAEWAWHVTCESAFSILCGASASKHMWYCSELDHIIYLNTFSFLCSLVHTQKYIKYVNISCLHPLSLSLSHTHTHTSFITSSAESTCSSVLEPSSCFRSLDGVVPPLLLLYDSFSGWPWKWQMQNECTHHITAADFMLKKSSVMMRYHFITQHILNATVTTYKMFLQPLHFLLLFIITNKCTINPLAPAFSFKF
jgi:hypothetical protein